MRWCQLQVRNGEGHVTTTNDSQIREKFIWMLENPTRMRNLNGANWRHLHVCRWLQFKSKVQTVPWSWEDRPHENLEFLTPQWKCARSLLLLFLTSKFSFACSLSYSLFHYSSSPSTQIQGHTHTVVHLVEVLKIWLWIFLTQWVFSSGFSLVPGKIDEVYIY